MAYGTASRSSAAARSSNVRASRSIVGKFAAIHLAEQFFAQVLSRKSQEDLPFGRERVTLPQAGLRKLPDDFGPFERQLHLLGRRHLPLKSRQDIPRLGACVRRPHTLIIVHQPVTCEE